MTTQPHLRVVGPDDGAFHPAYCDYVSRVFRQADFRRWCDWRQWGEDYRAFALCDGDRVLANASAWRMRLLIDGVAVQGYQLGAVGCLPEFRGQGLARRAMQAALAHCGDAPVLLFGNDTVRDFYPRFGFSPAPQHRFEIDVRIEPQGEPAATLDLGDRGVREAFVQAAATAAPVSERFGARDYGRIATWYAANGHASALRRLDEAVWVFARIEDGVLLIEDVFAPAGFDLRAALPRLIDRPVHLLRLGFTPERWWPQAREVGVEDDAGLFVRNLSLPAHPSRFPVLART